MTEYFKISKVITLLGRGVRKLQRLKLDPDKNLYVSRLVQFIFYVRLTLLKRILLYIQHFYIAITDYYLDSL